MDRLKQKNLTKPISSMSTLKCCLLYVKIRCMLLYVNSYLCTRMSGVLNPSILSWFCYRARHAMLLFLLGMLQ